MIMNDFEMYMDNWMNGISTEIKFWNGLFKSRGEIGGSRKVFEYRIDPKCPFQMPDELNSEFDKILDVGSGPYSRLGFVYNDRKLDITLVDPLAHVYKILASKYDLVFPIEAKPGMVETLSLNYKQNEFDIVHMSNSLDHCFNPVEGLYQLLYVTKVGGKVILRHHNNVGESENYKGFHQWNLTVKNNEFLIWRGEEIININEAISDFATVEFAGEASEELFEDIWNYNKVVIRKDKEFDINSQAAGIIVAKLLEKIGQLYLES